MGSKALKIDSLDLDLENPRITLATDQRDAMQKIIKDQGQRLITLAESVAAKGFNPIDRLLVMRSPTRNNRFVVLEGNRRVLVAKLLKNPALVETLSFPASAKNKLLKASRSFHIDRLEPVDCFEVGDREQGNEWIRQRHIGPDGGRGIVGWSTVATSRFSGRYPALQALDFVLEHGDLSSDVREAIADRFPLTTLDRLLTTPDVRSALGLTLNNGKLKTTLPPFEVLKPLQRIVLDLGTKQIKVNDLRSTRQQTAYVESFAAAYRPDLNLGGGLSQPLQEISSDTFSAGSPQAAVRPQRRPRSRTSVIPPSCRLAITVSKIDGIFNELKTLQLSKHVHSIGVLMRVFLEMSVDDYIETKAHGSLKFKEPRGGRLIDKTLRAKVGEVVSHLVAEGGNERDFRGVMVALSDESNPFSIDTLHAYIHNRFFTPTDVHLTTGWDNAQRFFEKIWPV